MLKSRYFCGGSALAVALTMGLAQGAAAQTTKTAPAASTAAVSEVVVTGSYIAGSSEKAALPIEVIGKEELAKKGSPSTLDLIKSLPISGPVIGDSNQFSTGAQGQPGAGSINLRGIGSQRTLVLLNGRRSTVSPGAGSQGVDTNLMPVAAIARVEILKDGAAATYGSDAIGGVVNFITRRNLEGLEVNADYRYVKGSNGDYGINGAWGHVFDNGNVLLSLGYQRRSELSSTKRSWANQPYLTNPSGWSILGQPPAFLPRRGATPVAGVTRDGNCAAVGGFVGFSGNTAACYFTYVPFDNLIEDEFRYQAYGEVNFDLNATTHFHAEALYAKTDTPHGRSSPGYPPTSGPNGPGSVGVFTVPSTNPGFNAALTQAGLGALIGIADNASLTLFRPLGAGGRPGESGLGGYTSSRSFEMYRVSAGFKGQITDSIGYDLALTYSDATNTSAGNDILIDRLQRALNGFGGPACTGTVAGANGCVYFNPFSNAYASNPALGLTNPGFIPANANSVDLIHWLAPLNSQGGESRQSLLVFDAVVNGKTGLTLPGGDVAWAAGIQTRTEEARSTVASDLADSRVTPCPVVGVTTCAIKTGPFIFLGQGQPTYVDGQVKAVFGELNIPVLDNVNAQLAVRYEDYGGQTGSTTNPKLAVKWQVTDALALRGSVGTTFRGPTPADRASTGVTGLSGITAAGNNFKSVDFFGSPGIGPETATTFNLGAIFEVKHFRAIVDYWNYAIKGQISSVPANVIASSVAGAGNGTQFVNCGATLRSLITFSNNNSCVQGVTIGNDIARIRSDRVNGPTLDTSGIDATIDYTIDDVFGGELGFGAAASYVLKYDIGEFTAGGVTIDAAYSAKGFTNYNRLPGTIPEWRGNFYANFNRGIHNLRATLNYVDGAKDNRTPIFVQNGPSGTACSAASSNPPCVPITFGLTVDKFVTLDLTYRVELPWNSTLSISALNIFDKAPSAARIEYSYDPYIGNPYGRTVKVVASKKF
ncbi:TonB-dependent receptor domain-containing protein [Phenylobacterium sp.]|uniref:TonB-dependent receptor plug domain-containing protein n=1 Tax=Phenylobacterium sp. TaxID=1871053 RepID=UPI00286ABA55|nr:TonB-dependent receptor [Phenylobacterium sp.]